MLCAECGGENEDGRKVCAHCGQSLTVDCSRCGATNPPGARFCGECGAPLQETTTSRGATAAAGQESAEARKVVTLVFCDVSGSTAMGERLDPESVRQIMTRYFSEMKRVLADHGGTVEKFIGDAVVAVFGIPVVHEDDALRGVRAAAEMRDALERLNGDLERRWGVRVQVRIGVNTGEVIAGDPTQGDDFATGDAVNVAARLEQNAPPGEVLIGKDTYRLVQDAVSAEAVEPLELKGKAKKVQAWALRSILSNTGVTRRLDSPLVGRRDELENLKDSCARAVQHSECELVALVGDAGVGKSRLTSEFLSSLSAGVTILSGRCLAYGQGITFWPISEVIRHAAGISDTDLPAEALVKIRKLIPGRDAPIIAGLVASLIGLSDAAGSIQESFWAVRRLFEALAAKRPLVVVFDDLHWAEPTLLDLIDYLAGFSQGAALFLLCLGRPELLDRRPGWASKTNATVLRLGALGSNDTERLMDNLLDDGVIDQKARERIAFGAQGNPLFVEEMLRMLVDDGVLERRAERWVATTDLTDIPIPPTINALLSSRLDRLPYDEKDVLQRGSVVGQVFWRDSVIELCERQPVDGISGHLQALIRKEILQAEVDPSSQEDAFRFAHILLRDSAYEAMSKALRAQLHEHFADWLETRVGPRLPEYQEIVGYHLEQAFAYGKQLGRLDTGMELALRAASALVAAGRRARLRNDVTAGLNLFSRAVDLLPPGHTFRNTVLPDLGELLRARGDFQRARTVQEEMSTTASALSDGRLEAHSILLRDSIDSALDSDYSLPDAIQKLRKAAAIFQDLEDQTGLARAFLLIADAEAARASQLAAPAYQQALVHARHAGHPVLERQALAQLLLEEFLGPTPVAAARPHFEEFLSHDSAVGRPQIIRLLGGLRAMQGDFERAREMVAEADRMYTELGADIGLAIGAAEMAWFVEKPQSLERAERVLRRAYGQLQAWGEKGMLSTVAAHLSHILYMEDSLSEAIELAKESRELAWKHDVMSQIYWRTAYAKLQARQGHHAEALQIASEARSIADGIDWLNLRGDAYLDVAEVLKIGERNVEARRAVQTALKLYERKGNLVAVGLTRSALEDMR